MPVISFASSKGGAGKTTSAIILATELAQGTDIVLIDADPAQPPRSCIFGRYEEQPKNTGGVSHSLYGAWTHQTRDEGAI